MTKPIRDGDSMPILYLPEGLAIELIVKAKASNAVSTYPDLARMLSDTGRKCQQLERELTRLKNNANAYRVRYPARHAELSRMRRAINKKKRDLSQLNTELTNLQRTLAGLDDGPQDAVRVYNIIYARHMFNFGHFVALNYESQVIDNHTLSLTVHIDLANNNATFTAPGYKVQRLALRYNRDLIKRSANFYAAVFGNGQFKNADAGTLIDQWKQWVRAGVIATLQNAINDFFGVPWNLIHATGFDEPPPLKYLKRELRNDGELRGVFWNRCPRSSNFSSKDCTTNWEFAVGIAATTAFRNGNGWLNMAEKDVFGYLAITIVGGNVLSHFGVKRPLFSDVYKAFAQLLATIPDGQRPTWTSWVQQHYNSAAPFKPFYMSKQHLITQILAACQELRDCFRPRAHLRGERAKLFFLTIDKWLDYDFDQDAILTEATELARVTNPDLKALEQTLRELNLIENAILNLILPAVGAPTVDSSLEYDSYGSPLLRALNATRTLWQELKAKHHAGVEAEMQTILGGLVPTGSNWFKHLTKLKHKYELFAAFYGYLRKDAICQQLDMAGKNNEARRFLRLLDCKLALSYVMELPYEAVVQRLQNIIKNAPLDNLAKKLFSSEYMLELDRDPTDNNTVDFCLQDVNLDNVDAHAAGFGIDVNVLQTLVLYKAAARLKFIEFHNAYQNIEWTDVPIAPVNWLDPVVVALVDDLAVQGKPPKVSMGSSNKLHHIAVSDENHE